MAPGPKPTEAEAKILGVLWQRGPSTVREVLEALGTERPVGYTGVLKLLQIMARKGLVAVNKDQRTHVYLPVEAPERTRVQLVTDLIQRFFAGSTSDLVLHALRSDATSPDDVAKVRDMLARYEAERGDEP